MADNCDETQSDDMFHESDVLEFRDRLQKAIKSDFVGYVRVHSVLHVIHKFNLDILTAPDIEKIEAKVTTQGDREGAKALLDYLILYQGWFPCLLKVLQHPEVKLSNVAHKLRQIHDAQLQQYNKNQDPNTNRDVGVQRQVSKPDNDWMNSESHTDPLSTLSLEDDSYCNNNAIPSSVNFQDDGLPRLAPESKNAMDSTKDERTSTAVLTEEEDESGYTEIPPSDSEYVNTKAPTAESSAATETPMEQCGAASRPLPPIPLREQYSCHGPEYDFTNFETSRALESLAGWHQHIAEEQVEDKLKKLCHEDGHYILWYWNRKKRPGLCVTFKNSVKTFIAHKRLAKNSEEQTEFYFERHGKHESELTSLVSYHLREGIKTSNNEVITFKRPVQLGHEYERLT